MKLRVAIANDMPVVEVVRDDLPSNMMETLTRTGEDAETAIGPRPADFQVLEHFEVWTKPDDYAGFSPTGDIVLYAHAGESPSLLDESNLKAIREILRLSVDDCPEAVYEWTARHWACGSINYIMLRPLLIDAELLDWLHYDIAGALYNYPLLDEGDYSERELNAVVEYWKEMTLSERVDMIRENGGNIFAARSDFPNESADPSGMLYETLTAYVTGS